MPIQPAEHLLSREAEMLTRDLDAAMIRARASQFAQASGTGRLSELDLEHWTSLSAHPRPRAADFWPGHTSRQAREEARVAGDHLSELLLSAPDSLWRLSAQPLRASRLSPEHWLMAQAAAHLELQRLRALACSDLAISTTILGLRPSVGSVILPAPLSRPVHLIAAWLLSREAARGAHLSVTQAARLAGSEAAQTPLRVTQLTSAELARALALEAQTARPWHQTAELGAAKPTGDTPPPSLMTLEDAVAERDALLGRGRAGLTAAQLSGEELIG